VEVKKKQNQVQIQKVFSLSQKCRALSQMKEGQNQPQIF